MLHVLVLLAYVVSYVFSVVFSSGAFSWVTQVTTCLNKSCLIPLTCVC